MKVQTTDSNKCRVINVRTCVQTSNCCLHCTCTIHNDNNECRNCRLNHDTFFCGNSSKTHHCVKYGESIIDHRRNKRYYVFIQVTFFTFLTFFLIFHVFYFKKRFQMLSMNMQKSKKNKYSWRMP